MRKLSAALAAGLFVALANGCTVVIPSGLLASIQASKPPQGSASPAPSPSGHATPPVLVVPRTTPRPTPAIAVEPAVGCDPDRFVKADADGDGRLSTREWEADVVAHMPPNAGAPLQEALDEEFRQADRDGSGAIEAAEFCDGLMPGTFPVVTPTDLPGPSPVPVSPTCKDDFSAADTNQDGAISFDEYATYMFGRETDNSIPGPSGPVMTNVFHPAPKDQLYAEFKAMDRNGDGSLSVTERCQPVGDMPPLKPIVASPMATPPVSPLSPCDGDFQAYDGNHDGALAYQEYVDGKYGQIRFIKAPTADEESKLRASFKADAAKLDTDQDGKLSLEEFRRGCQ